MKKVFSVFILVFLLNFLWEILQAFLYGPHFVGLGGLVKVHLVASLGDVLMIMIIFLLSYVISGYNFLNSECNARRFFSVMIIGFILAVIVEKYALATGRWGYSSLMPIIPFLNVGLTPVLQMVLIPLGLIFFGSEFKNKLG